jgi:predicted  nucleic acid-binding Zn-ribbon protein
LDGIPRNYHNEDDLNQAIKQKKKQYETTSMSNQDEKRLLQEIDKLERALPDMKKLSAIEPELAQIREQKKKIQAELDVVKRVIESKEDTISAVKQESQAQRNKQTEVKEAAEKFTVIIETSNEQISEIYKTKDKLREEYFKNKMEFEI